MYDDRVLCQYDTEGLSSIMWDYTTDLKHERRLRLENASVINDNEIGLYKIRLEFSSQDILEVGPARQLLVDVAEGLLDRLNSPMTHYDIPPPNYPITADQLEIYVDFQSFYGEFVDPYFVGWMVLENGMAYYYAFTLKNCKLDCWNVRTEPYFKSHSYVMLERAAEAKYQKAHPKKPHDGSLFKERYYGSNPQNPQYPQ